MRKSSAVAATRAFGPARVAAVLGLGLLAGCDGTQAPPVPRVAPLPTESIERYVPPPAEHEFDARERWVGDEDVAAGKLPPDTETVLLGKTSLTRKGLDRILSLPRLRRLDLGEYSVGPEDLRRIVAARGLRNLCLSRSTLGDDDLAPLAELSELGLLKLRSPTLTGRGLTVLEKLPRLTALILDAPQLSRAALEPLGRLSQLESLYVLAAELTEADLADLQALLPQLHIH